MDEDVWTRARRTLLRRRELLLRGRQAGALRAAGEDAVREPDWIDLATHQQDTRVVDHRDRIELRELHEIDAALRRLQEGVFGVCVSCGEAIEARRLEAIPETRMCVTCSAKSSARGRAGLRG